MSNQEAIALLRNLEDALDSYCELNEEGKTAFRMAIEALELFGNSEQLPSAQPETSLMTVKVTLEPEEIERVVSRIKDAPIMELAPSQPDYRLTKIADLVEGTIDHFDLDDAMDLLYQIKDVLK